MCPGNPTPLSSRIRLHGGTAADCDMQVFGVAFPKLKWVLLYLTPPKLLWGQHGDEVMQVIFVARVFRNKNGDEDEDWMLLGRLYANTRTAECSGRKRYALIGTVMGRHDIPPGTSSKLYLGRPTTGRVPISTRVVLEKPRRESSKGVPAPSLCGAIAKTGLPLRIGTVVCYY